MIEEQRTQRDGYVIVSKAGESGHDLEDGCAAVGGAHGAVGVAVDSRVTVAMLAIIYKRHGAPTTVTGGSFALDTDTFVRGGGGMTVSTMLDFLVRRREAATPLVVYSFGLLSALAAELTSDDRWDLF